jgi:hypothetical protein
VNKAGMEKAEIHMYIVGKCLEKQAIRRLRKR